MTCYGCTLFLNTDITNRAGGTMLALHFPATAAVTVSSREALVHLVRD